MKHITRSHKNRSHGKTNECTDVLSSYSRSLLLLLFVALNTHLWVDSRDGTFCRKAVFGQKQPLQPLPSRQKQLIIISRDSSRRCHLQVATETKTAQNHESPVVARKGYRYPCHSDMQEIISIVRSPLEKERYATSLFNSLQYLFI